MITAIVRKLEKFRRELNQLIVDIERLDIKESSGKKILFERRLFILMYFDRLTADRVADTKKLAKVDGRLGRHARMFFTDMQLVTQSVKEFYLGHRELSVERSASAECQRIYALMIYCVRKQEALISRVRQFDGKSEDVLGLVNPA